MIVIDVIAIVEGSYCVLIMVWRPVNPVTIKFSPGKVEGGVFHRSPKILQTIVVVCAV